MRIFSQFYEKYLNKYETGYTHIKYTIEKNIITHYFMTNDIEYKITLTIEEVKQELKESIKIWISGNIFLFQKFLNNSQLFFTFLKNRQLMPLIQTIRYDSNCCSNQLCEHVLYSYYLIDNIVASCDLSILLFLDIDIDDILEIISQEMMKKIMNINSNRVVNENVVDEILLKCKKIEKQAVN